MKISGKTNVGKIRTINQDTFSFGYLRDNAAFAVVCDGMGGQKAGHIASKLACDMVSSHIKNNFVNKMNSKNIKEILVDSIINANKLVYEISTNNKEYNGMGTTIVSVIIYKKHVHIVHIGDSRVYHKTFDNITQLTVDHSFVQNLYEQGKISQDEIKNHPQKNIITRAVGVSPLVEIDYINVALSNESKILLCTDGLYNYCDKDYIFKILKENEDEKSCEILIDHANSKGGHDNITIVILSQ